MLKLNYILLFRFLCSYLSYLKSFYQRPVPKFNQVLCSEQWVDFWKRLDSTTKVNDHTYDQTWIGTEKELEQAKIVFAEDVDLLKSMDIASHNNQQFDSFPKTNFFIGTGATVLCCGKGERLSNLFPESIPSQAKCIQCDVGQYQDSGE